MANKINLGVDKYDVEDLLVVVPEQLTNEELLELEQECIAKEQAKQNCWSEKKKKKNPQENSP